MIPPSDGNKKAMGWQSYNQAAQFCLQNNINLVGMARGYSAIGDYKKALGFAQKALPKAPDNGNKMNVEKMIKTLQEGKDIN